jgi:hypothetical protein
MRYALAAASADTYADHGYTVVWQDVVIGPVLGEIEAMVRARPFDIVVLAPSPTVVAHRESERTKKGYGAWTVEQLDDALRNDTPRTGHWVDSSHQSAEETLSAIAALLR